MQYSCNPLLANRSLHMRIVAFLICTAVVSACSSTPQPVKVTIIPSEERHVLHYEVGRSPLDTNLPTDLPPREVSISEFVTSLAPIVSYREFGLGVGNDYDSETEAGEAIKRWLHENTLATASRPSPYLVAIMNLVIYPPAEFKKSERVHNIEEDSRGSYYSLNNEHYIQLVREWLAYNEERKPQWLKFVD